MVSSEDVENFLNISGCNDIEVAKRYLEMFPGDMNNAINEYFSNIADEPNRNNNGNDDVRTPIPSFNDQLIPDYQDNIINSTNFSQNREVIGSDILSPLDDFSTQMFTPPESIMFTESFEVAKEKAKSQGKLILVNIQSPNEFSSMILNRDIWNDSLIIDFINENFIFWQRSCNTPDGNEWLNLYNISKLPHVSVVDPRTGRQLKIWDVAKSFSDSISASSEIIEFLESDNAIKSINRISNRSNSSNLMNEKVNSRDINRDITQVKDLGSEQIQNEVSTQDQIQNRVNQSNSEIEIPRINSELAMLHMERMRRKNSDKK